MDETSTSYVVEMQYQLEPDQQWTSVVADPNKDRATEAYGRCIVKPAATSGHFKYRLVARTTTVTDVVVLQQPDPPVVPDIPLGGHFTGPDLTCKGAGLA